MTDYSRQREGSLPYARHRGDNDSDRGIDNARRSSPRHEGDRDGIDHRRQQQSHHYGHRDHQTHHDQYHNYRDDYRARQGKDLDPKNALREEAHGN